MLKPRILVTGATGKTGSVVAAELLKAGYPVRVMVRRDDDRSARLRAQGAEVAVVDMSDVERVAHALRDVQRAYYCPPSTPTWFRARSRSPSPPTSPASSTSSASRSGWRALRTRRS